MGDSKNYNHRIGQETRRRRQENAELALRVEHLEEIVDLLIKQGEKTVTALEAVAARQNYASRH